MRMSLTCKHKGQIPGEKEILNSNLKRPSSEPKVAAAKELKSIGERASPYQQYIDNLFAIIGAVGGGRQ
ncbi:hypothetical protein NC651_039878 [Populus alba x Populus x berolinensis]|nr:hypothetical protein NC651_039878 [Populus alba x Populus x berolinensis]